MENTQTAPFPVELSDLVQGLTYKPAWTLWLEDLDRSQGSSGLTLVIRITTPDSYHPDRLRTVVHYFPVPPAAYLLSSWQRWLLEQVLLVERHEAMEFFTVDGAKPYAPNHGPGHDPYTVVELTTDKDRRTSYLGQVRDD